MQAQSKISKFASPLRYPGGKTFLANSIRRTIKRNFSDMKNITLVEPYAGGAGASLALLFAGIVNKIVINDFDRAIYSFWKIAVSDTDYLIDRITKTKITIHEWKKQKAIYSDQSSTDHELGFATLFLNRTNRSGILLNAWPVGGITQSGKWKLDARFNKNTIIERLKKIKAYKNRIKVKNLDGIILLSKLQQNRCRENYFIFLDPPYYHKGKSLYLNHYNDKDHEKLANFLEKTTLKWIMTYDDNDFICNLYKKMNKIKFVIQHSAYKSKKGKEVMIFCDSLT